MDWVGLILDVALLPLQLVLIPVDALLAQIPGIGLIPGYISSLFSFIGSVPQTIVALTGLSPLLWNLAIGTFVVFFTLSPTINIIKKLWAWLRP